MRMIRHNLQTPVAGVESQLDVLPACQGPIVIQSLCTGVSYTSIQWMDVLLTQTLTTDLSVYLFTYIYKLPSYKETEFTPPTPTAKLQQLYRHFPLTKCSSPPCWEQNTTNPTAQTAKKTSFRLNHTFSWWARIKPKYQDFQIQHQPQPSRLLVPMFTNLRTNHPCSVHGLSKFHRDKSMHLPQQKCRLNGTACEEQLSAVKCCPMIDGALWTTTMALLHATSRKKETRTLLECFNMHILMTALQGSRKTQNAWVLVLIIMEKNRVKQWTETKIQFCSRQYRVKTYITASCCIKRGCFRVK